MLIYLRIFLFSTISLGLTKIASALPWVAAEKACGRDGTSVGQLEWRAWRDADELVAHCFLHGDLSQITHVIVWTTGHGNNKTTLQTCKSTDSLDSNSSFYCEYRLKLPRYEIRNITRKPVKSNKSKNWATTLSSRRELAEEEQRRVASENRTLRCWVKTESPLSAEYKSWCSSDEIVLDDPTKNRFDEIQSENQARMQAMELAHILQFEEAATYVAPRDYTVNPGKPFVEPYGHYVVDVQKTQTTKHCIDPSHVLSVGVYPVLDVSPPSITFICRATFESVYTGNFSLAMYKANTSWPYQIFAPMKTCFRLTTRFSQPFVCRVSFPLTPQDRGESKFMCTSLEVDRSNPREPCKSHSIKYTVNYDPDYLPRVERVVIHFKKSRPNRGADRSHLPWDTDPPGGPGVRLNGLQYMAIGAGAILGLMGLSCCCTSLAGILGLRRNNLLALPCKCRDEVVEKGKKGRKRKRKR